MTTSPGETPDVAMIALDVARRYFLEDQSKVSIAADLALSRFQVARILDDARVRGLVRIEVGLPGVVDPRLSARIEAAMGLRRAVVVGAEAGPADAAVGAVAAALGSVVSETVREGDVVGVSWSRVIDSMARSLTAFPPATVVQLCGVPPLSTSAWGPVEIVRRLATLGAGVAVPLYAPYVVMDGSTHDGLIREEPISETLARARDLDVCVVSIGSWRSSESAVYDLIPVQEHARLDARGVVCEMNGGLLDAEGHIVRTGHEEHVIAADLADLRTAKTKIAAAIGSHRADAVRSAIAAQIVDVLVIDSGLATTLLGEP